MSNDIDDIISDAFVKVFGFDPVDALPDRAFREHNTIDDYAALKNQGLSSREIGDRLGASQDAVWSALNRAKKEGMISE